MAGLIQLANDKTKVPISKQPIEAIFGDNTYLHANQVGVFGSLEFMPMGVYDGIAVYSSGSAMQSSTLATVLAPCYAGATGARQQLAQGISPCS